MKTRTGFVSNSSSSSFVVLTTKENHEKVMAELHEYAQDVIKSVLQETKLFGKDMVYIGDLERMDGSAYVLGDDFDDTIDGKWAEYDDDDEIPDYVTEEDRAEDKKKPKRPKDKYGKVTPHDVVSSWKDEVGKNKEETFSWSEG